jgi:acetolactate synthase-1/2/3 large subunit
MTSGGEILCRALEELDVRHIFGVPGTQTVGLFEALRRSRIKSILATHELGAAFMANGYYRGSGRVGVMTVIPGPGVAYATAGLAEAAQDSAAVLCITGRRGSGRSPRKFDLQEIDQHSIFAPLVKRVINVDNAGEIRCAVRESLRLAAQGEPGPVLLQLDNRLLSPERLAYKESSHSE